MRIRNPGTYPVVCSGTNLRIEVALLDVPGECVQLDYSGAAVLLVIAPDVQARQQVTQDPSGQIKMFFTTYESRPNFRTHLIKPF
jgi:hypothetical protein